jgi:hypothetical protein
MLRLVLSMCWTNTTVAEHEGSTSLPPKPATGHDPESVPSTSHPHNLTSLISIFVSVFRVVVSEGVSATKILFTFLFFLQNRGSSVSIETRLLAGRPGSIPGGGSDGIFSLRHSVQTGSGDHPASYPMGTSGYNPRVKAAGSEADHSPPASAESKNAWIYTSTKLTRLHSMVLN